MGVGPVAWGSAGDQFETIRLNPDTRALHQEGQAVFRWATTQVAPVALRAIELADRAITVNVLEPGPTETAMTSDPRRAATPPRTPPLGRLVRAEEVAAYASFLLEDTGAMVTGQHVVICAGASL